MVRKKSHRLIGILVFFTIIYDLALKGITFDFLLLPIMLLLTMYASILPDVLEPSRNQHHRRFFHSMLLLTILIVFMVKGYTDITTGNIENVNTIAIFFICSGYASHLLADFLTYKGLPLTGL